MNSLTSWIIIAALAPAALWSQTAGGTAGVAVWMPDRAVIAIDSRMTLSSGDWRQRGADQCKVRAAGRFLIAIAGLHDHTPTKFNVWSLAAESASGAPSVSAAAAQVERRLEPELRTALFNIQSADLAGFDRHFGVAHLAFVIAGMDNGVPAMAARAFIPDRNAGVRVFRWEPAAGSTAMYAFGEHDAIDRAYPDYKALASDLKSLGPVETARKMIQLEIEQEPDIVGPPVSIVQFTREGPVWIQPGLCLLQ